MQKNCSHCKTLKELDEFHFSIANKDGHTSTCKSCALLVRKEWYKKNKQYVAEYQKKYRMKNIEKVTAQQKKHRKQNIERLRAEDRERSARKRKTLKGNLDERIKTGINSKIRRGMKGGRKWEEVVGYTFDQLKIHLEKLFTDGMTWDRFLNGEIHIDHKIPRSAFNYESPSDFDFKKCWELKNLCPMWRKENISKGNKLERPFQPSLMQI
jgi:hypothetical protein